MHALYALLDEYSVKVPDVDRAGYATLDSSYVALKALVEEVEGNKDACISNYSTELETGVNQGAVSAARWSRARSGSCCLHSECGDACLRKCQGLLPPCKLRLW